MKRIWKLSIIVVAVILIGSTSIFMSCDNLAGLSEEDLQNLETLLGAAFYEFSPEDVFPPRGISDSGENDFTVSWLSYTYNTITVNGSLVITMAPETATTGTATVVGTLTFTGTDLPIEILELDITVNYDLADLNPDNMTFEVSGTVTIDGTEYDAAGLTDEDVIKLIMQSFMSMIPTP